MTETEQEIERRIRRLKAMTYNTEGGQLYNDGVVRGLEVALKLIREDDG